MRSFATLFMLLSLVACTQGKETAPVMDQSQATPVFEKPLPKTDIQTAIMSNMTRESVTVFPLEGPVVDPFDNKGLQPLSDKVIADGYVVTDPSVTVYPPRPPQAMPTMLPMDGNIRADAQSAIVGARQKAAAVTEMPQQSASGAMYGGPIMQAPLDIQSDPLPPMPVIGADQTAVAMPPKPPTGDIPMGWVGAPPAPIAAAPMPVAAGLNAGPIASAPLAPIGSAPGAKSGPLDTSYGGSVTPVATPSAPASMPAPEFVPAAPMPSENNPGLLPPKDVPVIRPGMLTGADMPTIEKVGQ